VFAANFCSAKALRVRLRHGFGESSAEKKKIFAEAGGQTTGFRKASATKKKNHVFSEGVHLRAQILSPAFK